MPRRATTLTAIAIINAILVLVPIILFAILAMLLSGGKFSALSVIIILAGMAVAFFIFLSMAFAIPCSVVDNKGPLDAVRRSFSLCMRNIIPLIVYGVIGAILMVPMFFPGLGAIYAILFATPLMNGALLSMYKKAK
jgi:uncharacterized membrane protein